MGDIKAYTTKPLAEWKGNELYLRIREQNDGFQQA
jgi:hypothetical protein